MEQKKITHAARLEPEDNIQVEAVKQLLYTLGSHSAEQLFGRLQKQLIGSDGLQLLPSAVHSTLTDYDGAAPSATSEAIAEAAPGLYCAFVSHRFGCYGCTSGTKRLPNQEKGKRR